MHQAFLPIPQPPTAEMFSFNRANLSQIRPYPGRLLHKPRLTTQLCFRYFTKTPMSPALFNSQSYERHPRAVAVYCGAEPGTEPAFHHAATCKTSTLLFVLAFAGDSRENKSVSFSIGESPRQAWSAACVRRWYAGDYGHYLRHGPQPWWICNCRRSCCHASRRRRGRSDP